MGNLERRTTAKSLAAAVGAAVGAALLFAAPPAAAEDPGTVIRAALEQWRDDFNAGRAGRVCDLFAPDLVYDVQGLPEQTYALLCDRLHRALSSAERRFHYGLRIKEIIVSGDLAVVRLVWTSTVTSAGTSVTDEEPGLDVFRRQPDGAWKISRYLAYPANP